MKKRSILVVAAHPDDEVLGCGATIAKHVRQGDNVHVLILAEGATSRDNRRDRAVRKSELSGLSRAAHKAKDILGVQSLALHDYPDNRMDSLDMLDVIKYVESHMNRVKPNIVYTHHAGDINIDHRVINQAVVVACRPQPGWYVERLLFFQIPSSTEWQTPASGIPFLPNWYVDVAGTLALKKKALTAYGMEMRPWPHARSMDALDHLARWHGASIGVQAAEAFMVGRCLE